MPELNTIAAYNAVDVASGGTGSHQNDLDALNSIDVLAGGTGGHLNALDALNSTAVAVGDAGGHLHTLEALNAIVVAVGGVGGHLNDLDAVNEWITYGVSAGAEREFFLAEISGHKRLRWNPTTMSGTEIADLADHYGYLMGFDAVTNKVIVYRRFPGGSEEVQTMNRDGSGLTGLGWDDLDNPANTEVFSQMIITPGRKIAWGNVNNRLRIADYPSGANQQTISTFAKYLDLDLYPDGDSEKIFIAHRDRLRWVDYAFATVETLWTGATGDVYRVRVDEDAGYVFTIGDDNQVRRFDIQPTTSGWSPTIIGTSANYFLLEINPATETIYWVGASSPDRLYEYDYDGNQLRTSSQNLNLYRASAWAEKE